MWDGDGDEIMRAGSDGENLREQRADKKTHKDRIRMGTILLWTLELNRMKEPLILLLYFQVHVWGKHTTINL